MPLTDPHRSTVRRKLRPVIGDDSALEALMSQFPATDGDAPATKTDLAATKDFVRSECAILRAELRAEIHAATARTLAIMITAMIALNGITVGILSTMIANVK